MKVTVGSLPEEIVILEHFKALQYSNQLGGLFNSQQAPEVETICSFSLMHLIQ